MISTNNSIPAVSARPDVAQVLGKVLDRISASNTDVRLLQSEPRTPFHAPRVPAISMAKYMERLDKHMYCTKECFVVASALITRLEEDASNTCSLVNPLTVHRVVFTALVIGIKCHDDAFMSNKSYSEVGGVSLQELNKMERYMLERLHFQVVVSLPQYEYCRSSLDVLYAHLTTATPAPRPAPAVGEGVRGGEVRVRSGSIAGEVQSQYPAVGPDMESFNYPTRERRSSMIDCQ